MLFLQSLKEHAHADAYKRENDEQGFREEKYSGNFCSKTIRHKKLQIILAKYLSIENERFREQINLV